MFSNATVAGLDNETVGLDNITNSAQGNVTGKVAASDGMDIRHCRSTVQFVQLIYQTQQLYSAVLQ